MMFEMCTRGAILVSLLASCGGAEHARPAAAPAESPPVAAFRAYAAQRMHVAPSRIGDLSEHVDPRHNHGAAIAIRMRPDGFVSEARGWVTADRTVITPKQNLGVLLAEVGVWRQPSDLGTLASTLAEDLVWTYGDDATVDGPDSPVLTIAENGSGRLVFYSYSSIGVDPEPPPDPMVDGGGGGGVGHQTYRDTVTFTADHRATLHREALR